jgi:hypothetical protein
VRYRGLSPNSAGAGGEELIAIIAPLHTSVLTAGKIEKRHDL